METGVYKGTTNAAGDSTEANEMRRFSAHPTPVVPQEDLLNGAVDRVFKAIFTNPVIHCVTRRIHK